MPSSVVEVIIKASGAERVAKDFEKVSKAAADTHKQVEVSGQTATSAGGKFSNLAGSLSMLAVKGLAAYTAGKAVVDFMGDAIGAASDLNEETSKTGVVFGQAAGQITEFASTAADSIGQSETAAMRAANTFGVMFTAIGKTETEAANMSIQMTQLASDMASFNNASPEEAVLAIGAAMRGEMEPIRRFGVLLDDATLRQEALSQGLIKTKSQALTPAQKAMAAYSLILEQTAMQQGDFARTADGVANQTRTMAAKWNEFQVAVGQAVIPLVNAMIPALIKILDLSRPLLEVISDITSHMFDWSKSNWEGVEGAEALDKTLTVLAGQSIQDYNAAVEAINPDVQSERWDAQVAGAIAFRDGLNYAGKAAAEYEAKTGPAAQSTADLAESEKEAEQAAKESAEAHKELAERYQTAADKAMELVGASRDLADINAAMPVLMQETSDAIAEYAKVNADAEASDLDRAKALEDAIKKSDEMGDALVEQAEKTALANGETLSNAESIDIWNQSMVNAAGQAQGPLRQAILNYIATANQIPPEKMTEIQAAIDAGDYGLAEQLLAQVSRTRSATVNADANTANAERALNYTARNRTSTVFQRTSVIESSGVAGSGIGRGGGGTGDKDSALGGSLLPGQVTRWNENGDELLVSAGGGFILNAADTARALAARGGDGATSGGNVYHVTINAPSADPTKVMDALDQYVRAQGSRRLQRLVA